MRLLVAFLMLGMLSLVFHFSTPAEPLQAQPPDSAPLPHSLCRLDDGPKAGWRAFKASTLGVAIPYPPGWSLRESERGRRVAFVEGNRAILQVFSVDTHGLSPTEWLRAGTQAEKKRPCRVIIVGARVGRQCADSGTGTSTTFLALSNRVLAVEASRSVSRETLCGILMGIENLPN